MTNKIIPDEQQRVLARDPSRSVIVQAPAGSGITELLMQRYLGLLTRVEEPEEILAVTFTRKAATEMRHRILLALQPTDDHTPRPETAELAQAVLKRDAERGWQLLKFPGRLRIRTLDSVNSWLTACAPVSGDGTALGIVSDAPEELYDLAARRALELLADSSESGACLENILRHLDNRADLFVSLMAQMLGRRDQWLPVVGSGKLHAGARAELEAGLRELVSHRLYEADDALSPPAKAELLALLAYAAEHMPPSDESAPVLIWRDASGFPSADADQLEYWRSLADFCLTKNKPEFRKTVNKKSGFPTPKDGGDKAMTDRAKALLESFAGDEQLATLFNDVRGLPNPCYSDPQWQALDALIRILPLVAAELLVVFRERGETDYMQVATEALDALGDEESTTELALRLDYQINHILIDEFQDTSRTQFRLLEKLTAGWVPDDGRTLFIVGDPMQSIYRFRQAEVALFLELWGGRIGQVKLDKVQLTTNFRSQPAVVDWVNETFGQLMPEENNPATGEVCFARGTAFKSGTGHVELHPYEQPARVDEASDIADLVARLIADHPEETIGILVRTRNQARLIVPELRNRGIAFSGEALEKSGETSVEQDLIALTRALTHLADRTAWLALLRAPWCGLSLVDLELLCGTEWKQTVWEQLQDAAKLAALSSDGQIRAQRLRERLSASFASRGSLPLRDWVEGAWQQLGGPAIQSGERQLLLAEQFFATLDKWDEGGSIDEAFLLHERLNDRVDQQGKDEVGVHLLTLFKAKGLQYDTVILPALDGITRQDAKEVVAWHEYSSGADQAHYLMAPIEATGADEDPLHKLIRQFKKEQASFELDRFLYVACTRAIKRLHLYFGLERNKDLEIIAPKKGTLLHRLWPVFAAEFASFSARPGTDEIRDDWVQPIVLRLPADWECPVPEPILELEKHSSDVADDNTVTFDWAGSDAMRIGSVVHRCLQHIVDNKLEDWLDEAAVGSMLAEEGVSEASLGHAKRKVSAALRATMDDDRGRWILTDHKESSSEYPLTMVVNGVPKRMVIDRCFVDDQGVRWIIDYKTSTHEGGGLAGFLEREEDRYREQLNGYREAMQLLDPEREIKTALYFPLLSELRVVEFD
jgi:ATP-dependent helicase/nuclease subunit A